jgi:tRNA pseudouridine32 synthase/23S rRNA pseudouridine746 synthase
MAAPRPVFTHTAAAGETRTACEILAAGTGLSKRRVKAAMVKGAAWSRPPGGKERRLRRASHRPAPGEALALYYDASVLALAPPAAECRFDFGRYSVWFKPPGLLTQGSRFGDHASLLRQAELHFRPARPAFPVHRLDREAAGLVIVAHDRGAAGALSRLFARREVVKRYRAVVRGDPRRGAPGGRIAQPLDGKPAVTEFRVRRFDPETETAEVAITMASGRRHQIRRHFAGIGHPVMGDPLYGEGNKNRCGLQLAACALTFVCPIRGRPITLRLEAERRPSVGEQRPDETPPAPAAGGG